MARGNNEIIPLLVDTKNTIERSVKDVGGQVAAGNQELSRQLEGAVASILEATVKPATGPSPPPPRPLRPPPRSRG